MPLRSFAASRSSSVSSLHIPPPIRIPRPKVTLTAANGSPNPPARPQRASDAQLFVVSTASSRANRLSAPAVVTPSAYSQNSESQGNYRSPSSDNSSSLLHAEIGAAQHLSVTPAAARVLSTIMIHPSITDEIKTAMETPLPVCACSPVHSSQTGHSPSEENFPSGPLSAKSAVCFVKNRAEDAAARFDLDLLLMPDDKHPQSRVTSGSPQQRTPRADTPPPPLEDDLPEARCSSDTQSSFSSACTIQSQQSTVATSVASTSSAYSLHGPFHGTMRQRSSSAPSVDTHEVEELAAASPGLDNNRNITNPPHSPALSYEQTRVSQLSSDTLDKSMRRFILASMRTLVTEDPLLLQPESMRSIEEKLVALDSKIERLRGSTVSPLYSHSSDP